MTDTATDAEWFEGVDSADLDGAREAIEFGSADAPADWPARAVDAGFADDEDDYYALLHEATVEAARDLATERERADDQQLRHAVRAMDDAERTANELAERVAEWAGSLFPDAGTGIGGAREVARRSPSTVTERRVVALATRVAEVADEYADLRRFVESQAPAVAPNLSAMAGPVLVARLVELAGSLESLAKKPSGTIQVMGAEDALFAHLAGRASSPKHGVIYTHEYVSGIRPEDRGSAARALAGKLAIAARIDYYSGEFRPTVHEDLRERIETIRSRGEP